MFNKRLIKISSYVKENSKVIDVGCDHALLGIYLILNNKCSLVIASDINPKPLLKAKENVKKYHLEDKIIIKKAQGIESIEDDIDTVIIAGLGGMTICDILDNKYLKNVKYLILSPNNKEYLTRKKAYKLGYVLKEESLVEYKNIIYPIGYYEKGKRRLLNKKYRLLDINDKLVKKYYKQLVDNNYLLLSKIPLKYFLRRLKIKKEIMTLKKML